MDALAGQGMRGSEAHGEWPNLATELMYDKLRRRVPDEVCLRALGKGFEHWLMAQCAPRKEKGARGAMYESLAEHAAVTIDWRFLTAAIVREAKRRHGA